MKIKKFNENIYIPSNEEELISFIEDVIGGEVDLRQERYSDDWEVDPESVRNSAVEVVKKLKKLGVDFDILYNVKKYNL
jgi:metal-dependent HD superfamily phosphatase/phosphodiesterase